jgi:phospholipid/cholesterol/gamma-HCH transport system substrate-binding protein
MSGSSPLLKFGIFAAACLLGAAILVMELGNIDPFERRDTYEVVLPDAAGLLENDPVKIAGVEVGKVDSIVIERGQAVATFTVRRDRRLGVDSEIGVRWRNLLGLRFLYVYPAGDGELEPGHRFGPERVRTSTDLTAFLGRLTPVMRALDPEVSNVVVEALAETLSGREQEVQDLVANAGALLDELADRSQETARVITHGAELVDAYADREEELRALISSFSEVAATVSERNDALIDAIGTIADAEAELERLVADNEAEIRGSLDALDRIGGILSINHDELQRIFAYTGTGIVQYHRISRWGQWFNIRVPGLSAGEETMTTERGAELPPRMSPDDGGEYSRPPSSGPSALFERALVGVDLGGGG